jgi:hypothetical protein
VRQRQLLDRPKTVQRCDAEPHGLRPGSYGAGEEGLEAMVDDIKYVCMLWRVGCTKGKVSNCPYKLTRFSRTSSCTALSNVHVQALSA